MKVNVVKYDIADIVRVPVNTAKMMHIEIEMGGLIYRIHRGEIGGFPDQVTGLRVTVDGTLIVRPVVSNAIEIDQL